MEKKSESNIKVIAIKLPFDLEDRILTFPFLHSISEYYPKADIHLITSRKEVEVLNLLPFKAYYHLFNEEEIKTIFDIHPYTANAAIYNVDLFISLTNSFSDASLGLGLRAKMRVGFSDDWKTLLLTHKIKRPVGHHLVEDYMGLYELITGESFNRRLRVNARSVPRIIEDDTPYIAINLYPLKEASINDDWLDLISKFEGKKIIFFASEEQVKVQLLIENFMNLLHPQNTYIFFYYDNWIELSRMLSYSNGVITFSGAGAALSAYVGSRSIILYEQDNPERTAPFYFLSDVEIMGASNKVFNEVIQTKTENFKVSFDMSQVHRKAVDFFRF
jgi:ADP-heptose:LPS heptosyltransferase